MKRRRPWASSSTVVTVLLSTTLWTTPTSEGIPVFPYPQNPDALEFMPFPFWDELYETDNRENENPDETNVTPVPTEIQTSSPTIMSQNNDNLATKAPSVRVEDSTLLLKESFPVSFDLVLSVKPNVDLNDLLKEVKTFLEEYLLQSLQDFTQNNQNNDDITIRFVKLVVTLLARRQMMMLRRHLQQDTTSSSSREITVQVGGDVQYDISGDGDVTPEFAEFLLEEELATLLTESKLSEAIGDYDADGIEDVLTVEEATIVEGREQPQPAEGTTGDDTTNAANIDPNEGRLERPSTLSIIFGFILTGIAAAGLIAYAYIGYRKRQKRLRRERQMKASIQYRLPSSKQISPASNKRPPSTPQQQQQQQQTMVVTPVQTAGDDSSDDESSYKGIESVVSEEAPADSFARELQFAASLDEQAWENFQRKKDVLDRNEGVVKATNSRSPGAGALEPPGEGSRWAKSFPYGDEVLEEGVEWTADQGGDVNDWEPYNSRLSSRAEEKKEEPPSVSTAAALQSIERDLARYGVSASAIGDDPEADGGDDMTPNDAILEVERLSKFVKRYEKRKERRLNREKERMSRSSDSSGNNSNDPIIGRSLLNSSGSPDQTENISYLNNMRSSAATTSQRETEKSSYRQEHVSRISSYLGSLSQDPLNAELRSEIMSLSDEEESDQEDSIKSQQRLGITPFSVQKPEELSFSDDAMSPMMQTLAKKEAAMRMARGDHNNSIPIDEQVFDRRRAQSDGEYYHNQSNTLGSLRGRNAMLDSRRPGLSALRTTDAIIDSSQSDFNVGIFPSPSDERHETPRSRIPQPRTPKSNTNKYDGGTSPNPRFNKLRNLFEERPNEAIFPPDQHWQYGVAK
jgi:hypothetical protein